MRLPKQKMNFHATSRTGGNGGAKLDSTGTILQSGRPGQFAVTCSVMSINPDEKFKLGVKL